MMAIYCESFLAIYCVSTHHSVVLQFGVPEFCLAQFFVSYNDGTRLVVRLSCIPCCLSWQAVDPARHAWVIHQYFWDDAGSIFRRSHVRLIISGNTLALSMNFVVECTELGYFWHSNIIALSRRIPCGHSKLWYVNNTGVGCHRPWPVIIIVGWSAGVS